VSTDLRTLRIYKMRGGKYIEGRQAFQVTNDGIVFLGGSPEQAGIDLSEAFESIWPAE